jgi:TonB family protein
VASWLAAAAGATAQTQPPANPVVAHYRAYRAALDQGDMAAAEQAASAALDASVSRDGDGGATGVLAINLAQARLTLGRRAEAYDPAFRAFTIASAGSSNLDPLLTRLVLGRAELTDQRWRQGRDRLQPAIEEARARADLNGETYSAAADLGRWLFSQEQYGGALRAWEVAMQMADATTEENDYARAEARMGHAAALFTQAMASTIDAQARPTDTRFQGGANDAFDQADRELLEAQSLIGPYAHTPNEDVGLSLGQRVYASAVAWRTLVRAFAESRGLRPLTNRAAEFRSPLADPRPVCNVAVIAEPRPDFPSGASQNFTVGAVVVRFIVDEAGQVTDSRIAAAIPERGFRDAVERVTPQWRLELQPDSAPNCRYYPIEFVPVRFYFR